MREAVAEAQIAEKVGFDSCLLSEHHQQADGYLPNPILAAGLIGMKTEKMRVGTCITLLPLQHPVHVVEDCAIIDQMIGGRMILGVGVGYQGVDFDSFGASAEERAKRTEEGSDIIKKCWTGALFSSGQALSAEQCFDHSQAAAKAAAADLDGGLDRRRHQAHRPHDRRMAYRSAPEHWRDQMLRRPVPGGVR